MTSAPSRASCKATARPMPDVAPVTRAFWPWRLRGWVAGTVALRNLVVDKLLGAHNSVVSVMVPDHASVDPSGANTPRCAADLVMIRAPCVYLASRGPPPLSPSLEPRACLARAGRPPDVESSCPEGHCQSPHPAWAERRSYNQR